MCLPVKVVRCKANPFSPNFNFHFNPQLSFVKIGFELILRLEQFAGYC